MVCRDQIAHQWTPARRDVEELGPFRLAYLEALVRMADWRASASMDVVGGTP